MKTKLLFATVFLLAVNLLNAQQFEWAKSFGGTYNDMGFSISIDASGNVYTTGYFEGTVDFNPGAGTSNLTSAGGLDVFVQKMDASGNFLWAKSFGGIYNDQGYFISIDASGNIYTTGRFEGTPGDYDIFVQKMDSLGNFLWSKSFGGTGDDRCFSIDIDASGNVYTSGDFEGTVDFNPGAGTYNLTSAGHHDIFVQKMDASGNFLWAKSFGGSSIVYTGSMSLDASGNIYTTGCFKNTADFNPGAGTYNLTAVGIFGVFVQKMDASGDFLWAKSFGGTGFDRGYSIDIDASGNVYTTGFFNGTVDFDPGAGTYNLTAGSSGSDTFVQKMDASGNFLWAKSFEGTSSGSQGNSISIEASGNVYTTGRFGGTVDFNPGVGTYNLTSAGSNDAFVQKMDASGNFLWAKSFGGSSSGNSISIDASENIYTTGSFRGTVDFNPGAGTYNLTAAGINDAFVQKMSTSPTGINENSLSTYFTVYPNPTNEILTLNTNLTFSAVRITNAVGKLVFEADENNTLDVSSLKAGSYFIQLIGTEKQILTTEKFIKK